MQDLQDLHSHLGCCQPSHDTGTTMLNSRAWLCDCGTVLTQDSSGAYHPIVQSVLHLSENEYSTIKSRVPPPILDAMRSHYMVVLVTAKGARVLDDAQRSPSPPVARDSGAANSCDAHVGTGPMQAGDVGVGVPCKQVAGMEGVEIRETDQPTAVVSIPVGANPVSIGKTVKLATITYDPTQHISAGVPTSRTICSFPNVRIDNRDNDVAEQCRVMASSPNVSDIKVEGGNIYATVQMDYDITTLKLDLK